MQKSIFGRSLALALVVSLGGFGALALAEGSDDSQGEGTYLVQAQKGSKSGSMDKTQSQKQRNGGTTGQKTGKTGTRGKQGKGR